jgi:hypothetical protein
MQPEKETALFVLSKLLGILSRFFGSKLAAGSKHPFEMLMRPVLPTFEHTDPPITAIDKPLEQMFARSVELLIERINHPGQPLRAVHLAPTLKERESVKTLSTN